MLLRNKYAAVAIGAVIILIVAIIAINFTKRDNRFDIIEKTLNIDLHNIVKIQNFTYFDVGGYYCVKAVVEKQNVTVLKNELHEAFHGNIPTEKDIEDKPNYGGPCSWWDLNDDNISIAYHMLVWGEYPLPDSREVWAFITKEKDEQYYLYIVY